MFDEIRRDPLSELFEGLDYAVRKNEEFIENQRRMYAQWYPVMMKNIIDTNPLFKILTEKKKISKKKFRWVANENKRRLRNK
jgi:hypothetical protein